MAYALRFDNNDFCHDKDGKARSVAIGFGTPMNVKVDKLITPLFESGSEEQTSGSSAYDHAEKGEEVRHTVSQSKISGISTAKFRGLNVRSNLVPILERIWSKRGNIFHKCVIRNGDLIANALETLATAVLILEGNSASTISDSEADYLSSALSDLKYMRVEVDWLVPYVEKAVGLHSCKTRQECLKMVARLNIINAEKRSNLLVQLAEYEDIEMMLEKLTVKLSVATPYTEEANFEESLGIDII